MPRRVSARSQFQTKHAPSLAPQNKNLSTEEAVAVGGTARRANNGSALSTPGEPKKNAKKQKEKKTTNAPSTPGNFFAVYT
jgi:hypothetical protein